MDESRRRAHQIDANNISFTDNPTSKRQPTSSNVRVIIPLPPRARKPLSKEPFKCKWKRCKTVLHNLDTLVRHVKRVHKPSAEQSELEGYTCWWKKCELLKANGDGQWIASKSFTFEEWIDHINEEHIMPIAWKYGDGPSTLHTDPMTFQDDHKSYLYNTKHELVTPLFDGTSGETDVIPLIETSSESMRLLDVQLNADFVHYSDWLKSHNISSNSPQESREVIRAIEKKKAAIGPGLDRGGCILITEEMRHNFVQNPGIRRIIANDKS